MTEEDGLRAVVEMFIVESLGKEPKDLDDAERLAAEIMIAAITVGWEERGLWYSEMLTKERDMIERKEV